MTGAPGSSSRAGARSRPLGLVVILVVVAVGVSLGVLAAAGDDGSSPGRGTAAVVVVGIVVVLLLVVLLLVRVARPARRVAQRNETHRAEVAVWAYGQGLRVRQDGDAAADRYPPDDLSLGLTPLECEQVLEGSRHGRGLRVESWHLEARRPGAVVGFPRWQQRVVVPTSVRIPPMALVSRKVDRPHHGSHHILEVPNRFARGRVMGQEAGVMVFNHGHPVEPALRVLRPLLPHVHEVARNVQLTEGTVVVTCRDLADAAGLEQRVQLAEAVVEALERMPA